MGRDKGIQFLNIYIPGANSLFRIQCAFLKNRRGKSQRIFFISLCTEFHLSLFFCIFFSFIFTFIFLTYKITTLLSSYVYYFSFIYLILFYFVLAIYFCSFCNPPRVYLGLRPIFCCAAAKRQLQIFLELTSEN